jgi:hypothetical protein
MEEFPIDMLNGAEGQMDSGEEPSPRGPAEAQVETGEDPAFQFMKMPN